MPLCIVAKEHTIDPKGVNNPDDFIQVLRGEVVKLTAIDNLITTGYVSPIADSDRDEIVICKCGRMFSSETHPHFSQAQLDAELLNANDFLATLEAGTAGHTEQAEKVAQIEARIAAANKEHHPVGTLGTVAKAKVKAEDKTVAKAKAKRARKAKTLTAKE